MNTKVVQWKINKQGQKKVPLNKDFRKLYRTRANLVHRDDVIYHRVNMDINTWRVTPVLPPELQVILIQVCHDDFGD